MLSVGGGNAMPRDIALSLMPKQKEIKLSTPPPPPPPNGLLILQRRMLTLFGEGSVGGYSLLPTDVMIHYNNTAFSTIKTLSVI